MALCERESLDKKLKGFEKCPVHPGQLVDAANHLQVDILESRIGMSPDTVGREFFQLAGLAAERPVYSALCVCPDQIGAQVICNRQRFLRTPEVLFSTPGDTHHLSVVYADRVRADYLMYIFGLGTSSTDSVRAFIIEDLDQKDATLIEIALRNVEDGIRRLFVGSQYHGHRGKVGYYSAKFWGVYRCFGAYRIAEGILAGFFLHDGPPAGLARLDQTEEEWGSSTQLSSPNIA